MSQEPQGKTRKKRPTKADPGAQAESGICSREDFLASLNEMAREVLLSRDFDSTLRTLAVHMARLINADDCCITRWDPERGRAIPVATSKKPGAPDPPDQDSFANELAITTGVLEAGQALTVDGLLDLPNANTEAVKQVPTRAMLGVPLIVGEHKLGAAVISFNAPRRFSPEEIERSEQAGAYVALALWNFQQSLEIQQRLRESNALAKIGRALSETERVGIGKVLQLIVDSAREIIPHAEESVIHLLDREEQALVPEAISGFSIGDKKNERSKMMVGEGIAGQVIREGITINVGDIDSSPHFLPRVLPPTYRSLLVGPVQVGGRQIGTISVQSSRVNAFSRTDAELLNALGIQAAIAIENTRLFETTQQRLKEVDALYRTSQGLVASLDADQLIEDVVTFLQQNFDYYHVQICLLDSINGDIVFKIGRGKAGNQILKEGSRLSRGAGIIGHVIETAAPFVTNNVNDVVFFFRNPLLPDTQSELTVPIILEGEVVGVLDIQQTPPRRLTEGDLHLMSAVADQLAVALQKASLYKNLQTALQQEQATRSQLLQNERLALVGRLLASVSHELNNPLQAIQNALFLLKEDADLSNQGNQDLDIILSETERMAALIERLRSAYRPVRINDFQPVQLNNLIEDVYALIATHMRHKQIAFNFFPDPQLPVVSGLSDQIRQVVLNLFLNAIEVMKPGGCLSVQTHNRLQQNEVLLEVRDTGPGIDAEILPHIFDAFTTNKLTGTGLGLTITHDIIQQHHGRIEAGNDPRGGAIFKVWLPTDGKG